MPRRIAKGTILVTCNGEAHGNPFIDNCMVCMPRWGWVEVPRPAELSAPEYGCRVLREETRENAINIRFICGARYIDQDGMCLACRQDLHTKDKAVQLGDL